MAFSGTTHLCSWQCLLTFLGLHPTKSNSQLFELKSLRTLPCHLAASKEHISLSWNKLNHSSAFITLFSFAQKVSEGFTTKESIKTTNYTVISTVYTITRHWLVQVKIWQSMAMECMLVWSSCIGTGAFLDFNPSSSLLRSCFLGCHATLPPKKRLLTTEQHSFPLCLWFGRGLLKRPIT